MTREEILALEPGPALDDAVAEHVMGWKRTSLPGGWTPCWKRPDRVVEVCTRDWSRTWAGAGRVVERMAALRWNLELDVLADPERTRAQFWRRDEGRYASSGFTPLMPVPEAVSKAALLALTPKQEADPPTP